MIVMVLQTSKSVKNTGTHYLAMAILIISVIAYQIRAQFQSYVMKIHHQVRHVKMKPIQMTVNRDM
jgi:hypothetical protein